jgi:hypothetical protein
MPEGKGSQSKRDGPIVAWHEVPETAPPQKNRSVGHDNDLAQTLSQRYFASKAAPCFLRRANHSNHRIGAHTGANQTVPYGTALLRWALSRHFVPGYDRAVPPGLGGKAPSRRRIVPNTPYLRIIHTHCS